MENGTEYTQLVRKAQQGDRAALNELAEIVKLRLYDHVKRITLDEQLAQDIVQETLLAMTRDFQSLRKVEGFWYWLSRIAINKARTHYRSNWGKKTQSLSQISADALVDGVQDTVAQVISHEVKQIVASAMYQLSPEYRTVLTLRCYDQLTFPQIAEQLNCREFRARALFCRAKTALGKNLARDGLGKGSLIGALVIFGKMTVSSEAAAADLGVSAALLNVGLLPTAAVAVTGRVAVALTAMAASAVAIPAAVQWQGQTASLGPESSVQSVSPQRTPDSSPARHVWYYYPPKNRDVVMIQTRGLKNNGSVAWQWLQNEYGNYQRQGSSVCISNAHYRHPDLSVMRLPTDQPRMRQFLDQIESRQTRMEYVKSGNRGVLVACGTDEQGMFQRVIPNYKISDAEAFAHPWPRDTRIIDQRDVLHARGWAYFQITGNIAGQALRGLGRLPFVPSKLEEHYPWLRLYVRDSVVLEDGPSGAYVHCANSSVERFPPGKFWRCLSRPWTGLHCLDTVRRDAAAYELPFQTLRTPKQHRIIVSIQSADIRIQHEIDMEKDLVQAIGLYQGQEQVGYLSFAYIDTLEPTDRDRPVPRRRSRPSRTRKGPDCLWLISLVKGSWE